MLLVSLSHDAKAKSMRVREIQYLCFCFSDLCVSEPTLQVLNECFEEGVVSEPWMASAGVEPWMDSSTDEHFPRSTAGALFPNTAGKSIQALCVITVAGMARSYRS